MNINEQMQELATMGGLAYAPTDDVISILAGQDQASTGDTSKHRDARGDRWRSGDWPRGGTGVQRGQG